MALNIGELTGYLSMDASGFTGAVQDALGSLKSKEWQKAGAGAGVVSATALAAGFKSNVDMSAAVNKTSAQLGLTAAEADKAGKVAGQLYRDGLGESMSDVSNATGAVIASMNGMRDASQADLEGVTRSALIFAQTMDVDVGAAATTAGTLLNTGLAKNGQEAFDLLTKASQQVGPTMTEPLMDATNEYSKHFAMLGYSGDQAMSVLAEAASGGEIAIDKAGDAVKELGIRATDLNDKGAQDALKSLGLNGQQVANDLLAGGDRAQGAMKQISDSLLAVEDPAERAALAGGLFGTQIEDIGKDNLPGFLQALGSAQGSLGDVEGATKAMGDTLQNDAGSKLQTFARMVQSELMELVEPAVAWLTPMIDGLSGLSPYIAPIVLGLGAIALAVGAASAASALWNGILAIQAAWTATATAAQWLWNAALDANPIGLVVLAIAALVGALVWFFTQTDTGRQIWETAWGAIKAAASAVADWFMNTALPVFQAAWSGIAAGATWLWQSVMVPVWQGIMAAISAVGEWITGTLVPWLQSAWTAIASAATWLWQSVISPVWEGIRIAIALAVAAVMTYIDGWVLVYQQVLAPVIRWLYDSVIKPVWDAIKIAIGAVVAWFQNTAVPFLSAAAGRAGQIFGALRDALGLAWAFIRNNIIQPVVTWFQTTVVDTFGRASARVQEMFAQLKLRLGEAWAAIRVNIIQPVMDWFQNTVVASYERATARVSEVFAQVKARLAEVWAAIKGTIIAPVLAWFQGTVVSGLTRAADAVKKAFETMRDGVGAAWDAVKEKVKAPIKFVVDTVINNGIVSNFNKVAGTFGVKALPTVSVGFATGGVLPGYTPGRDVHSFYSPSLGRLDLSGGEAIMRPEFTRAVGGPAGVARLNLAARRGGIRSDAFASGGVWSPRHSYAGGGVLDWLKDKASFVKDALSDPAGAFKKITEHFMGGIPGAGLMTDLAKGAANKIASGIGDYLTGKNKENATGGVPAGGVGKGGSLAWAAAEARRFGLVQTSGYRPGARTSSGSLSMHGLNRARDFSNGHSPTPQMMAYARHILANSRPTELLYSPLGAANMHRDGRQYPNTGTVRRIHFNHVHVAYRHGGVLGALSALLSGGTSSPLAGYATGTLNASPGWHMVGEQGPELVRFRGGEQVLNARDTQAAMAGRGVQVTNHFHEVGGEAAEIAALRVQNRMMKSVREVMHG